MNPTPPLSSYSKMVLDRWYMVYILKCKNSDTIYIGCTSNIEKRLKYHGSALRNLKLRIQDAILSGGAG